MSARPAWRERVGWALDFAPLLLNALAAVAGLVWVLTGDVTWGWTTVGLLAAALACLMVFGVFDSVTELRERQRVNMR